MARAPATGAETHFVFVFCVAVQAISARPPTPSMLVCAAKDEAIKARHLLGLGAAVDMLVPRREAHIQIQSTRTQFRKRGFVIDIA